jgi:uncharacterized iron-regulated protein
MFHESGVKVAIGMEMFRRGSQKELDNWISGRIDEDEFEKIYTDRQRGCRLHPY